MSPMRTILLLSPYWREEHRWMVSSVKLAELWQRMGYRVVVLCMGSGTTVEHVSPTLEIHRIKDFFIPDPFNYGIAFGFSCKALQLVRSLQPDHIIVNKVLFWSSISTLLLRILGHKLILLTDALVGMTWWPRSSFPRVCAAIYAWTLGWLILLSASKIVFFHPQPKKLLSFLGIAHKSGVIPTGIDPAPFIAARTDLQKQVDTSKPVRVTYIGRLESVKGVDDFLAAATSVQREHSTMGICVAGFALEDHPLRKQYSDSVQFIGLQQDVAPVLSTSDIFVLPSYSEGLSNALMEAMASGCACIASDVGGNRYLLENGISGFLFAPGDRAALASHIRRLIEDPWKRRSMSIAARERILKNFSWDQVSKQYDQLFSSQL